MSATPPPRTRFRDRLKQFLQTVGGELDAVIAPELDDPAPAEKPSDAAAFEESAEFAAAAERFESETRAAAERADEDEQQLAAWQATLDELLEARRRQQAHHAATLTEASTHLASLVETARAREAEETELAEEAADGAVSLPAELEPADAPPEPEPFTDAELSGYQAPSLEFLRPCDPAARRFIDEDSVEAQKNTLQDALDSFAVDAFVYDAIVGPRVTQFRVKPGFGVRVEAIAALARNITLAMKVRAVRIQAPIPGEPFVGIEAPNGNDAPLTLRSALESRSWAEDPGEIPLALGIDLAGRLVTCDLAKAPHALIAGATGSGKSVCISNLILSLLYRFRPDELELVLIDPKKVEFALYKDLPHLIHPVVSDPKQACQALKWLVREMEHRYDLMAERKVRNIAGYNLRAEAEGFAKMPYIVLIVDELADLMMTSREDVETPLARLAQMSRAVGIHTILATQRPSVNIITGIIKANYPTRVAFQVSSQIDSRTILDVKGAESLQGRGDLLYNPPGVGKLLRLQAPYVDDEELLKVTDHLRGQVEPRYRVVLRDEDAESNVTFSDEVPAGLDPLIKDALHIVATTGRASTSFLQRKLKIGYNRAANLIEQLEERGYIGPQIGTNPREIFVDPGEINLR